MRRPRMFLHTTTARKGPADTRQASFPRDARPRAVTRAEKNGRYETQLLH